MVKKYTEEHSVTVLKEGEAGIKIGDLGTDKKFTGQRLVGINSEFAELPGFTTIMHVTMSNRLGGLSARTR